MTIEIRCILVPAEIRSEGTIYLLRAYVYCSWRLFLRTSLIIQIFYPLVVFPELVVFTDASKGPGLIAANSLIESGKYHVVIPTHDATALQSQLPPNAKDACTAMECDLTSFDSVKSFCAELEEWRGSKKIDRLVLGASTYTPELAEPRFTVDGHETIMQVNYLSHYLMVR